MPIAPLPDGTKVLDIEWEGAALPTGAFSRFVLDMTGFAGSDQAAADAIAQNFSESLDGIISSSVGARFLVRAIDNGGVIGGGQSAMVPGAVAGQPMPPSVAFLVQKTTATGGRSGRGRWYIPGVPEAASDAAGVLTAAYFTALATEASSFRSKCEADSLVLQLASNPTGAAWTFLDITGMPAQSVLATQRRRMRR